MITFTLQMELNRKYQAIQNIINCNICFLTKPFVMRKIQRKFTLWSISVYFWIKILKCQTRGNCLKKLNVLRVVVHHVVIARACFLGIYIKYSKCNTYIERFFLYLLDWHSTLLRTTCYEQNGLLDKFRHVFVKC